MEITWLKRSSEIWKFIGKKRWDILVLFVVLVIVFCFKKEETTRFFSEIVDPFSGIFTFLLAIYIAWEQFRTRWDDQLEIRMNLEFMHGGTKIAEITGVELASKNDLRNYSLSLAGQMFGGHQTIEPMNFNHIPEYHMINNKCIKVYTVQLNIVKNPFENNNTLRYYDFEYFDIGTVPGGEPNSKWTYNPNKIKKSEQKES